MILNIPMLLATVAGATLLNARVFLDTKGICFFSGNVSTDNEKMLKVASQFRLFSWPSSIHKVPYGRGQLRELWVMGLSLMGRLFSKPETEHINVALGLFAHGVSGVLSFIILSHFFGEWPALFCALFYLGSVWGYEVCLYLGHVIYSQMWFLLALLPLVWMDTGSAPAMLGLSLTSGALTAACFFASSASRKYPPMVLVVFMAVLSGFLGVPERLSVAVVTVLGVASALGLVQLFVPQLSKWLVVFAQKKFEKKWDEQATDRHRKILARGIRALSVWAALFVAFALLFVRDILWFAAVGAYIAGVVLIALYILLPNVLENTKRYYVYLKIGTWASHFKCYPDHLKSFGRHLPDGFRGEGLPWIPKFLARLVPVPFVLYCLAVVILFANAGYGAWGRVSLVLFLSVLPTLITEVSKGIQVGKSYFPSFSGLLIAIAAAIQFILEKFPQHVPEVLLGLGLLGSVHLFHGIYTYRTDVLPSRMGPSRLRECLLARNISSFFTYDNSYNDAFVKTMLYSYPGEFSVQYVENVEAAGDRGTFVVPPTSSKSVSMESQKLAILDGDFRQDSILNELLDSGRIENIALEKIKTLGTSRIYVHESEVTSYRDLGLHQITDRDRWLGHGWVLDLATLDGGKARL